MPRLRKINKGGDNINWIFAGLAVIVIAWLWQLYFVFKGSREISKGFLGLYILGVIPLAVSDFRNGNSTAWLQLGTMVAAGIVLVKLFCRKGKR